MSIALTTVSPKHERRIRLFFSNSLASGAFVTTLYTLTCLDGKGSDPNVVQALAVPNSPNVVELVLDADLVDDALYQISCPSVPAVDLSVTPTPTTDTFRFGARPAQTNLEPIAARTLARYLVDLIWNGADFQETPNGDLDRVSGTANVTKALNRGVTAAGLPWDPNYGARAREYVDSPQGAADTLRGAVAFQCAKDPRVRKVSITFETVDSETFLHIKPTLITGEPAGRVSIVVPSDTS